MVFGLEKPSVVAMKRSHGPKWSLMEGHKNRVPLSALTPSPSASLALQQAGGGRGVDNQPGLGFRPKGVPRNFKRAIRLPTPWHCFIGRISEQQLKTWKVFYVGEGGRGSRHCVIKDRHWLHPPDPKKNTATSHNIFLLKAACKASDGLMYVSPIVNNFHQLVPSLNYWSFFKNLRTPMLFSASGDQQLQETGGYGQGGGDHKDYMGIEGSDHRGQTSLLGPDPFGVPGPPGRLHTHSEITGLFGSFPLTSLQDYTGR